MWRKRRWVNCNFLFFKGEIRWNINTHTAMKVREVKRETRIMEKELLDGEGSKVSSDVWYLEHLRHQSQFCKAWKFNSKLWRWFSKRTFIRYYFLVFPVSEFTNRPLWFSLKLFQCSRINEENSQKHSLFRFHQLLFHSPSCSFSLC
jgi:hypothetical protein